MLEYIKNKKEIISTHLLSFLEAKSSDLSGINAWGEEIPRRIYSFSREGKMIRGALVLFANEMCSSENADDAMKAACAVEILQSYLLIHDDIMDRDRFRRGAPSVYYTFQLDAEKTSMENPAQYGESMGICAGDVAIFMALELLARCSPQALRGGKLVSDFSREMTIVGLGQMQDVYFSHSRAAATTEEVLKLYRYKTSRYTFSLPLYAGASIAGRDDIAAQLEAIGENLGIIFQIKDDELGLFGASEEIGKVAGSDIREGKMTYFITELVKKLGGDDALKFKSAFGNASSGEKEIEYIRALVIESGVRSQAEKFSLNLADETRRMIREINAEDKYLAQLEKLLNYNLTRRK